MALKTIIALCILIGWTQGRDQGEVILDTDKGIILEPTGTYISQYGYHYIPVTFSIPTYLDFPQPVKCGNSTRIKKHHQDTLRFIQGIVPTSSISSPLPNQKQINKSRSKRWVPLVVGAVSLGLSIWNSVSTASLQKQVKTIEDNVFQLQLSTERLIQTTNSLIDDSVKIHHIVSESVSAINQLINVTDCLQTEIHYNNWESSWMSLIVNTYLRAVDAALRGKLTPDILSFDNLNLLIAQEVLLQESLYNEDKTLIYEISTFLPISIKSSPPMIIGVIIAPKLSRSTSGIVYTSSSVPWIHNGGMYKLKIPSLIVIDNEGYTWVPNPAECTMFPGLTICPKKFYVESRHECLSGILRGVSNNTNCLTEVKTGIQVPPSALQLQSGVLLSGWTTGQVSLLKKYTRSEIKTVPVEPNEVPQFFTEKDGDLLMVGSDMFQLSDLSHPYDFSIRNLELDTTYYDVDPIMTLSWTHIEKVPSLTRFGRPGPHHIIAYGLISFTISLVLVSLYFYYKRGRSILTSFYKAHPGKPEGVEAECRSALVSLR